MMFQLAAAFFLGVLLAAVLVLVFTPAPPGLWGAEKEDSDA